MGGRQGWLAGAVLCGSSALCIDVMVTDLLKANALH